MKNETEEEIIQRLAKFRHDKYNGLHHISLEFFIEEERAKRKPGYVAPLPPAEIAKISRLMDDLKSDDLLKKYLAKFKLALIKRGAQKAQKNRE